MALKLLTLLRLLTWKGKKRRLWTLAVVVGVIVLTAEHYSNSSGVVGSGAIGTPQQTCIMKVTDTLNVRSGPGVENPVMQTLASGAEVAADRVTRNGFRQLGPNRWAAQQYLIPMPGSNCN